MILPLYGFINKWDLSPYLSRNKLKNDIAPALGLTVNEINSFLNTTKTITHANNKTEDFIKIIPVSFFYINGNVLFNGKKYPLNLNTLQDFKYSNERLFTTLYEIYQASYELFQDYVNKTDIIDSTNVNGYILNIPSYLVNDFILTLETKRNYIISNKDYEKEHLAYKILEDVNNGLLKEPECIFDPIRYPNRSVKELYEDENIRHNYTIAWNNNFNLYKDTDVMKNLISKYDDLLYPKHTFKLVYLISYKQINPNLTITNSSEIKYHLDINNLV